jgi:hypothetical protein
MTQNYTKTTKDATTLSWVWEYVFDQYDLEYLHYIRDKYVNNKIY